MKLKDLTKEQMERICHNNHDCSTCVLGIKRGNCCICLETLALNFKDLLSEQALNMEFETIAPLLTDKEKEYLSNVIKPFRDRVDYIIKKYDNLEKREYIYISLGDNVLALPYFRCNEYYANMLINIRYSLEELGL